MYINTTLLLVTTFGTMLSAFSQLIVKHILSIVIKDSEKSREVRREIAETRTEMAKISMMDEFAKHARLQRKLIKLQQELKTEKLSVSSTRLRLKVILGSATSILMALFMVLTLYFYRAEPVLVVPHPWLSPFSTIISWPSVETGAVSTLFWIAVSTTVTRFVAGKVS